MGNHQIFDLTGKDDDFHRDMERLITLFKLKPHDRKESFARGKQPVLSKWTGCAASAREKIFAAGNTGLSKFAFVYLPLLKDKRRRPLAARLGVSRQVQMILEGLFCALTFVAIEGHFRLAWRREARATGRVTSAAPFHACKGRASLWANQL